MLFSMLGIGMGLLYFGKFRGHSAKPTGSRLQNIKLWFWQKVAASALGANVLRALSYLVLAFSAACFCLSLLYGNLLFTSISFLAVVMIMLNIELVRLNRSYSKNADLYGSMSGIRDDLSESSSSLKENNIQLKQEVSLLQNKIKKLESLLLGMEKIINDSHSLNSEQTAKFTEALGHIIESTDLTNATSQAEFAKILVDYEGMSERLAAETKKLEAVTAKLDLKTEELASANAALRDTNKDFRKVCVSLETITTRLEQLYKVGVISERYLTTWSSQLKVVATGGPKEYVKSTEINQNFIELQSFCDSLRPEVIGEVPVCQ